MAKQSKKKKAPKKVVKNTEKDNQIKYLSNLLVRSLDQVQGRSEELDDLFTKQANRLLLKIEKLKENQ